VEEFEKCAQDKRKCFSCGIGYGKIMKKMNEVTRHEDSKSGA
jgi:hypothetical protein